MRYNYDCAPRPIVHCCVCQKRLYGRSDKVFCDIHCKNHYHSDNRKKFRTVANETQKLLKKNYFLFCYLMGRKGKKFKISLLELKHLGFQTEVVSRIVTDQKQIKMFVFDFCWAHVGNDTIEVTLERQDTDISPFIYRRWEYHQQHLETKATKHISSPEEIPPNR